MASVSNIRNDPHDQHIVLIDVTLPSAADPAYTLELKQSSTIRDTQGQSLTGNITSQPVDVINNALSATLTIAETSGTVGRPLHCTLEFDNALSTTPAIASAWFSSTTPVTLSAFTNTVANKTWTFTATPNAVIDGAFVLTLTTPAPVSDGINTNVVTASSTAIVIDSSYAALTATITPPATNVRTNATVTYTLTTNNPIGTVPVAGDFTQTVTNIQKTGAKTLTFDVAAPAARTASFDFDLSVSTALRDDQGQRLAAKVTTGAVSVWPPLALTLSPGATTTKVGQAVTYTLEANNTILNKTAFAPAEFTSSSPFTIGTVTVVSATKITVDITPSATLDPTFLLTLVTTLQDPVGNVSVNVAAGSTVNVTPSFPAFTGTITPGVTIAKVGDTVTFKITMSNPVGTLPAVADFVL